MISLSWWSRLLKVLFAAGQFALPAALSIGDATVSDDGRAALSHVEDSSRAACRAPHAGDCAVCRYLSALVGSPPAESVDVTRLFRGELSGLVSVPARSLRRHGFLSRAPHEWNA